MAMSAERGKIADDVSVSDPQSIRTVSQRSNVKTQRHFRFSPPRSAEGFQRKTFFFSFSLFISLQFYIKIVCFFKVRYNISILLHFYLTTLLHCYITTLLHYCMTA